MYVKWMKELLSTSCAYLLGFLRTTTAHWAKNRGQKDINSKIVEKGKIMNLLDGFQSLLWIKTISKIFVTDFSDFLMKFWEISKKCSNFVNFRAKKMFFFLNRSEFHQKKIGSVISDLMTTKCDIWRHFWWTIILTYVRMLAHCALVWLKSSECNGRFSTNFQFRWNQLNV